MDDLVDVKHLSSHSIITAALFEGECTFSEAMCSVQNRISAESTSNGLDSSAGFSSG